MIHHPSVIKYDAESLVRVCRELDVRLLVLFGSYAAGRPLPRQQSDLDLAVMPGYDTRYTLETYVARLCPVFDNYSLDLVFLNRADPLFRYEIMRTALLLYGDRNDFFEYRAFAYKDFIDSEDLRALEENLFQKKMAFLCRQLSVPLGEAS